ncbi:Trypsin, partial [Papilio machaon]
ISVYRPMLFFFLLVPSGRRIYKGERTKIKHYPFMASIQIFDVFQCAGSIIKSDLIITASSCLQLAWNNRFYRENPAFLAVRVGSSFYNSGGERIAILEIYFHPDYNPKNLWNNICVLRLERHIKFLKTNVKSVKKIAIDKNPWNLPVNTPGITIIGWGAKSTSNKVGDPFYNILSFSHLDVYPTRECQEVYSK